MPLAAAVVGLGLILWYLLPRPEELPPLPLEARADKVVVYKSERLLMLMRGQEVLKHYPIALGFTPLGHKQQEGDGRTPEGLYTIDWRNPDSRYHLSLHISYPNDSDKAQAEAEGVDPGGAIMIHGLPNILPDLGGFAVQHRMRDWTAGCIAVTNQEIEEIWRAVPDGTPIEIRP